MTTSTQDHTETTIDLMAQPVTVRRGGAGPPLVLLPHDTGVDGWGAFHAALAEHHDVIAPVLPGYDGTPRFEWMRTAHDMAATVALLLDRLNVGPHALAGLGFGGWLAAELATTSQALLTHLVLVGAAGIHPQEGEIADQFLVSHIDYVRTGFASNAGYDAAYGDNDIDRLVRWDENREMTGRIAWKPYMYNPSLPALLAEVRTPALIVWGREDGIVPVECADHYAAALLNAQLHVLDAAGHHIDIEQPAALAERITAFTRGDSSKD